MGSGTREAGGCWSPGCGGGRMIRGRGEHMGHRTLFCEPQPVSFSVSPRRAAASSSGGTCAGASRAFTVPVEWPAVPGQVGAVPSPGVPLSHGSSSGVRGWRGVGFGKPKHMPWQGKCHRAGDVVASRGRGSVPRGSGDRGGGGRGVPAGMPALPPGMCHLRGRRALPDPGGPGAAGGRPLLPGLLHVGRLPQHAHLLPLPTEQGKADPRSSPSLPQTPPSRGRGGSQGWGGCVTARHARGGSPCPGSVPTGHRPRVPAAPSHLCPCRGSGHRESSSWRRSSSDPSSSTSP